MAPSSAPPASARSSAASTATRTTTMATSGSGSSSAGPDAAGRTKFEGRVKMREPVYCFVGDVYCHKDDFLGDWANLRVGDLVKGLKKPHKSVGRTIDAPPSSMRPGRPSAAQHPHSEIKPAGPSKFSGEIVTLIDGQLWRPGAASTT